MNASVLGSSKRQSRGHVRIGDASVVRHVADGGTDQRTEQSGSEHYETPRRSFLRVVLVHPKGASGLASRIPQTAAHRSTTKQVVEVLEQERDPLTAIRSSDTTPAVSDVTTGEHSGRSGSAPRFPKARGGERRALETREAP